MFFDFVQLSSRSSVQHIFALPRSIFVFAVVCLSLSVQYISVLQGSIFMSHTAIYLCYLTLGNYLCIVHCSLFLFFRLQCNLFYSLCNTLSFSLQYIYVVLCDLFVLLVVLYLSVLAFFIAYIDVLPRSVVVVFSTILLGSSVCHILIL